MPTNRLSRESSPYLLQHQHNPVDWHPWGPEAFEQARAQNRPIFLSVGYSTCYWCHVMERESFENDNVAAEMNRRFVCIKVDREERPDVDQLYMTAVQVLTRHGGWPMSVFLTPDLKPFYGGTYFPPADAPGRPGFVTLLNAIDDAWKQRRDQVNHSADELTDILRQLALPPRPDSSLLIDDAFVKDLIERSTDDFDPKNGGFGSAPKFPRQTLLELLLAYIDGNADPSQIQNPKSKIFASLDAMADGGIRDQLGGGFHRYSTDAQWLVPHFEIMLYDNAMLAWIYAEAYRQFRQPRHAAVARGILDFLLRDMTSADGAFYTAFDAEVDGREGQSYLWTRKEMESVLKPGSQENPNPGSRNPNPDPLHLFLRTYALDGPPNFADPHHGTGKPDRYVLHLPRPMSEVAAESNLSPEQLDQLLEPMRQKLLAVRQKRKQPLLDTKILTSWNALAIRAFAHAGRVLNEPRYTHAAQTAADWLLTHHLQPDGTLLHATRPDRPGRQVPGFLDDYAALILALIELDNPSGSHISNLTDQLLKRFAAPAGGFYFTDRQADDLIVRQMVASDSPLPSGNAMAALALIKLNRPQPAGQTLIAFAESLRRQGEGMSALLQAALAWNRRFGPLQTRDSHQFPQPRKQVNPPSSQQEIVSMQAAWTAPTRLDVHLTIADGFHLNAHDAPPGLIPTTLSIAPPHVDRVQSIDYPPGQEQSFSFQDHPLRVYTAQVTLSIHFTAPLDPADQPVKLLLHYQPCTDDACLQPTTLRLTLNLASPPLGERPPRSGG
jgi:uncharacterized protein YyaL (SSP411 family)